MEKINPNRLHLLIASLFALCTIAYGISLLIPNYSAFKTKFTNQLNIKAWEDRTGTPYEQLKKMQSIECQKIYSEKKYGLEDGLYAPENEYRICMMIQATVIPSHSEVIFAFVTEKAHLLAGYIVVSGFMAWLLGFLVAKGIPKGVARFWTWLTASDKKQ